jgi:tRNA dimethylallyltransferase
MQIYREMSIGTAKPTDEERAAVPHHLVDFLSPTDSYSADSYRVDAMRVCEDIISRGRVPIFVGGTGLYIDTVARAAAPDVPPSDPALREKILASVGGDTDALSQRLSEVDPESAEKTHKNNSKRVLRALEIYEATGRPKSYFDALTKEAEPPIRISMITLDFHDRDLLYSRIDTRVDMMLEEGLLDEARLLYERGYLAPYTTAAQAIGYKELIGYLEGSITLDAAVEELKLASRRYAKRQLTWFRREEAYHLYLDDEQGKMRDVADVTAELLCFAHEKIKTNN